MDHDIGYNELARYFAGESSGPEVAEILSWASANPSHGELLESTRRIWESAGDAGKAWHTEEAWKRMEARMDAGAAPAASGHHRFRSARLGTVTARSWPQWAIAASLAALVAIGLLRSGEWLSDPVATRAAHEMTTASGERAHVRLSDGTRVTLAPGSRVEVPQGFGDGTREVRLTGEAYFAVAPDPTRPFVVHAGGAVTRVLGTEFGVRAYPDDPGVRVVVAEGRVSMRAAWSPEERTRVLRPGEMGQIQEGEAEVVAHRADVDRYLGWREGQLIFEGMPLEQVAREIERWYGVPIRIGEPALSSRRVTASFRDQPLDEVIEVIATSLGTEWTRRGRNYIIGRAEERRALAPII